jgi:glycyl-tRNA synthetase (class II)
MGLISALTLPSSVYLCLQEAEQMLAGVGEMGADALHAALTQFGAVAPDTKNPISSPFPFNLMFKTSIGPRGDLVGYLRPETAQVSMVKVWRRMKCPSRPHHHTHTPSFS